jgi:DNA-binding transcriptional regulator YiaG
MRHAVPTKNKVKRPRHTKAGRKIIAALQEITDALDSGKPLHEHFTIREVEIVEPGEYDADAIRQTRAKVGVSQAVFAQLVGVSTILEQSWEQGKRFPDATARRLLDEINREPRRWLKMLHPVEDRLTTCKSN